MKPEEKLFEGLGYIKSHEAWHLTEKHVMKFGLDNGMDLTLLEALQDAAVAALTEPESTSPLFVHRRAPLEFVKIALGGILGNIVRGGPADFNLYAGCREMTRQEMCDYMVHSLCQELPSRFSNEIEQPSQKGLKRVKRSVSGR